MLHLFNHPVVAALLLTLAFLGLVVEVRSRGFHRAGWAGLLALALFVLSHVAEGTPLWTAVPLALGVLALWPALADPSRRWSILAGGLLIAVGAYSVLVGPGPAHLDHARALSVVATATLLVLIAAVAIWSRLPAQLRPARPTGVFFQAPDATELESDVATERSHLVGAVGTALSSLEPAGEALIRGERLEVVTEGAWITAGEAVEVVEAEGVHPVVRPAPTAPAP